MRSGCCLRPHLRGNCPPSSGVTGTKKGVSLHKRKAHPSGNYGEHLLIGALLSINSVCADRFNHASNHGLGGAALTHSGLNLYRSR